jgi:hypothetical protein
VWGDLRQKSEQALAQTLARHGGHRYSLRGVHFDGTVTRYATYTVHRQTVLTVRDAEGAELDLRLYGSSVQKDGTWKVFSYVVDE